MGFLSYRVQIVLSVANYFFILYSPIFMRLITINWMENRRMEFYLGFELDTLINYVDTYLRVFLTCFSTILSFIGGKICIHLPNISLVAYLCWFNYHRLV